MHSDLWVHAYNQPLLFTTAKTDINSTVSRETGGSTVTWFSRSNEKQTQSLISMNTPSECSCWAAATRCFLATFTLYSPVMDNELVRRFLSAALPHQKNQEEEGKTGTERTE